jgi:TPR repeat protein
MERLAIALLSLGMLCSPAWAGFDEGWAAYVVGNYVTAFKEWQPLAKQGHASAQAQLGFMYAYGKGVRQDAAEAVKWYRKAAEQGDPHAQFILGSM